MEKELSIELFDHQGDFQFLSKGIFDNFKSCIVTWKAYSYNTFQLTVPLVPYYFPFFKADNVLSIADCYFYIDVMDYDGAQSNILTVSGKSLLGKASKRIINPPYSTNSAKPEAIIYDLINKTLISTTADKAISYLSIKVPPDFGGQALAYQNSYGTPSDEINSLADSHQICLREVQADLQNPKQEVQFYQGRDLSGEGGVEFGLKDEGLKSESLTRDISDKATVAYVFGEGEGTKRKMVMVSRLPTGKPNGLDVCEIYVDARDLQQSYTDDSGKAVTLTDEQYLAQLTQRGNQALDEHSEKIQLNGEVNFNNLNFVYGKDYEVGDTVRVTSQLFGISKSSVLTAMQETWDDTGYHLDPTFDKDRVTLIQKIQRK
ncbi:siphovirus ReqiPepy6 Gp37-like family protein [Lactococcus nasutitermitis]|uniref:Siphovirus ReqiPepy6 Gp37-like family protein n=1 Tax=Lactococcus nasutitermitis TaxID=1652957 RepID=A0ABV9JF07_9LACT|nr:siphovirus ReqiPepy6 Gp37-like family protein [Lactococcus nasutitermitis]